MPPVDPFILIPNRTKDLRTCVRRLWLAGVDIVSNVQQSIWYNWSPWPHAVTSDGAGGMYVLVGGAWSDSQALELHHVDASGVKSGPAVEPELGPGAPRTLYSAKLVSSTDGSCIVVWKLFAGPGNSPLLAQRFDQQCNTVWPAPVELVPSGIFYALAAAEDGASGAVIAVLQSNSATATPDFRVQRVNATGNLQWGPSGNQGPAPGPLFAASFHAPRIFSVGNAYVLLWLSNLTSTFTLMAAWLDAGGQVTGGPFSIGAVGEGWWERAGVRRAVADDHNGFWAAAAPLAPGQQLRLLRFGPGATVPAVTAISRNLAAPSTYALAADGNGGVFVVTADPAGVVGVDHFDFAGSQQWANTPAARFTTIPIAQLPQVNLSGDYFPARLLSVAVRGSLGIVVSYEDWQNSAAPRLRFRCFDRFGGLIGPDSETSPGLGAQSSALFIQPGLPYGTSTPAQLIRNDADGSVNCAWLTKSSASTRTISAQKLGCCAEVYDVDKVPNPWLRNRCAIPIDFPPTIPGTINISFPCSRESFGDFGLLPLPHLARVPGLTLPGSLVSKNVPPPDWVRIQFGGVPDDVEIAIYAHTGERIARAKHLPRDVRDSTTRELTFRPEPQLSYVLAFTRKPGDESSPGFIPIGVAATFGAGRPPGQPKLERLRT
jgi:hypothetical protein